MFDYFHFRYRRAMRRARREARLIQRWTRNYIDRHIWGKWHQLGNVRRFLLIWWAVLIVAVVGMLNQFGALSNLSRQLTTKPGGSYSEAEVGAITTLNPLIASTPAETDADRLIFSGLTRYNTQRELVGDLAASWSISSDGKTYTFKLRKGVKWQDGVPFTSTDVVFTLAAIQNPDTRSPLASSWQGVKAEAKGDDTVVFTLPNALDSFLDSTTLYIVPQHLLESVEPTQLAENDFSLHPVGTGPFSVKSYVPAVRELTLAASPSYYGGKPKLDEFVMRSYDSSSDALDAFASQQVTSPGRITPPQASKAKTMSRLAIYPMTLPVEVTLFFANGDAILNDKALRATLSRSIDRQKLLSEAAGGDGVVIQQPLLPGQVGYTNAYAQASLSAAEARASLADLGWGLPAGKSVREKGGKQLTIRVVTLKNSDLERAAISLQSQWTAIGVKVDVVSVESTELQQTYIRPRNFQAVLIGLNVGGDPDVYSFWHSSQAKDPGLNLSGYASADADKALEAGRLKSDPQVRQGKYNAFIKAWDADAPAAVLYQTGYNYGTSTDTAGVVARQLVSPSDRFYGVEGWTILRRWMTKR